ncbi:type II toxin-antitoxin system PemK/MazF family toxin [Nitratidesulfovibrio vulgaris]|uniref:Transcriptional modulator of MazE/toxin, MazF n=1 Tax=Nitratidesulfovibrio vulgaris (strain ATCC 29579 / DSM 644 / CCUG 34227 / NCIMB 8303 / VKM B-1760 / Hildenborough) TaxID=882 RepID=Q72BX5_NITV2|nr:type II toxin-antitoxin system PemK/MazF family toxin [Nitratidesulfovibrio vulgaris]AAS95987.1 conserved hypothetical protein [Nitratidesulfovibrio vulgaris str. Hildenborough]
MDKTSCNYSVGDIVYCDFPATDMSETKDRPTLIVAQVMGDDVLVCMITKRKSNFEDCIEITSKDIENGNLIYEPSYVRPVRLATVHKKIIRRVSGRLSDAKISEVLSLLRETFASPQAKQSLKKAGLSS